MSIDQNNSESKSPSNLLEYFSRSRRGTAHQSRLSFILSDRVNQFMLGSLLIIAGFVAVGVVQVNRDYLSFWSVVFPIQLSISLGASILFFALLWGDVHVRLLLSILAGLLLMDNLDGFFRHYKLVSNRTTLSACETFGFEKGMKRTDAYKQYLVACKAEDVGAAARLRGELYRSFDPVRACMANRCPAEICSEALERLESVSCPRPLALPQ